MAAYDSAVENAFLSSVTNIRRAAFSICYLRFGFSQCWRVPSRLCSVKLFCMNGIETAQQLSGSEAVVARSPFTGPWWPRTGKCDGSDVTIL